MKHIYSNSKMLFPAIVALYSYIQHLYLTHLPTQFGFGYYWQLLTVDNVMFYILFFEQIFGGYTKRNMNVWISTNVEMSFGLQI